MALIGPGGRPVTSGNGDAPASAGSSPYIKDASLETFAADVLEASREVPVIVDFWAPWCGPCKQLGPALEKLVNEAKGAVRMVKVNVDENQEIAQQLRIQSIPTVYAFKNGQPVDGFMGARPRIAVARLCGPAHRRWPPAPAASTTSWRRPMRPSPAAMSPARPRPMAPCCRTIPAIPRRSPVWRAAI